MEQQQAIISALYEKVNSVREQSHEINRRPESAAFSNGVNAMEKQMQLQGAVAKVD